MIRERRLTILPIGHTSEEEGRRIFEKANELAVKIYRGVNEYLAGQNLRDRKTYFDTFPENDPEGMARIAASQSHLPIANVVRVLRTGGAKFVGIEDQSILDQFLKRYKSMMEKRGVRKLWKSIQYNRFLNQMDGVRDRKTAEIIGETLGAGEEGILIIGYSHFVQQFLPADIQTHVPADAYKYITRSEVRAARAAKEFERYIVLP